MVTLACRDTVPDLDSRSSPRPEVRPYLAEVSYCCCRDVVAAAVVVVAAVVDVVAAAAVAVVAVVSACCVRGSHRSVEVPWYPVRLGLWGTPGADAGTRWCCCCWYC